MHRVPNMKTKGQKNARKLIKKLFNTNRIDWTTRLVLEKVFWTIVYVSGAVLFALSCNDLYNQYQQNPIALFDSNGHHETFILPSPTVCLPFFPAQEKRESYNNDQNGIDEWKANQSTWAYVNDLNKFFKNKSWAEIQNADWSAPMIIVAQNFLSVIYETESLGGKSNNRPLQNLFEQEDNISLAIAKSLIPKIIQWNVTLPEFRDEFSRQFQNIYPIAVNYTAPSKNMIDKSNIAAENMTRELVFVNKIQVCFRLGFENFLFGLDSSLQLDVGNIFAVCPVVSNIKAINCHVGFPPATIDLTGQARAGSIYREFDSIYLAPFWEDLNGDFFDTSSDLHWGTKLTVNPSIQYISLPVVRGVAKCSPHETKEVCREKCRIDSIQDMCNCSAIKVSSASQSEQPSPQLRCSFDQYESCMKNFTGSEDTECVGKCLDICTSLTWDVTSTTQSINDGQDYHAYIEFTISSTDYIVTTESIQWTLVAIIGVIGGAVGFWLGLDIATFVYSLLTVPLSFLNRKFSNRNNDNQEVVIETVPAEVALNKRKLFDQSWDIKDPVFVLWAMRKLIWSAVFIAGAALTILMFVQLIQQYLQHNTQINMNVMFNDSITIPDAALCLGAGRIPASKRFPLWQRINDFWPNSVDPIINQTGYMQSELQKYMNQKNMSKETFLGADPWPATLTFMAYVYLFALSAIIEEDTPPHIPFSDEQLVLHLTRNILLNLSVSNEELQQKLAIEYMKLENMTTSCYSSTENISVQILPTKATFEMARNKQNMLAPLWLCLHFPLASFQFRSTNDICSLTANTESDGVYNNMYFIIKSSTSSYQNYYKSDVGLEQYTMTNITLAYATVYQNFLNCANTYTSFWDCWDNCRTEIAERECSNCTIASGASKISAVTLKCTWDEYISCLKNVPFEKNCTHQCKYTPCTIANPERAVLTQTTGNQIAAELNIKVTTFNYVLMMQQWAMTKSDFFANSGGLLGFWLGTDCTFFISIVFTPLMLFVGKFLKKITSATNADPEEISIGRLLLLESAKIFHIDITRLPKLFIIKALFERIFWLVVYIVFGAFTLIMYINFHQQYISTPIGSSYKDVNSETYKIPPVTLCIPWVDPATANITDQEDFEYITDLLVTEMKQLISTPNSTWPMSLLRISLQYLELMEGYKAMDQVDLSNMWGNTSLQLLNTTQTLDIFDKNLEFLKITSDELMQKFGQQMLQQYSVILTKWIVETDGSANAKLMTINQTTFVSSSTICFSLPQETTSFASVADYFTIQSSLPNSVLGHPMDGFKICSYPEYYNYYSFEYSVSLDLLGRQTGTPMDDFVFSLSYFDENRQISIKIDEVIQVLPEVNGVRRCSDETSHEACVDECRVKSIEQQCNCTLGSDQTKTERSACSWTTFKNCLPQFSMINASNCIDKCLPSCEIVHYSWNFDSVQLWQTLNGTGCHLGEPFIGMNSFQYRLYTEQLNWSFYSYVAGLGGIIGILLGIDVILFIEWLLTLANWLFSFFGWCYTLLYQKKKTIETQQNVENELKIVPSRISMRKSKIVVVRPATIAL